MKKTFLKINKINYPNISYGFFTRLGGYSKNNYKSLNCSYSSGDNYQIVNKNIEYAKNQLNLKEKKLKISKQIHSNIIKIQSYTYQKIKNINKKYPKIQVKNPNGISKKDLYDNYKIIV